MSPVSHFSGGGSLVAAGQTVAWSNGDDAIVLAALIIHYEATQGPGVICIADDPGDSEGDRGRRSTLVAQWEADSVTSQVLCDGDPAEGIRDAEDIRWAVRLGAVDHEWLCRVLDHVGLR